MPGTLPAFAEALQRMRGTNLNQEQAMEALYATLAPGKNINTKELAPFLAQVLRERAAPKLNVAMRTSQAQQARFQNTTADMAILASSSGLEAGFSRLFRALNDGLKEAGPMIESLARGFDNVTKGVSSALLVVQSFQRFFQGRDSAIGDMLFPTEQKRQAAFEWLESMKGFLQEMNGLIQLSYDGWKQLLDLLDGSAVLQKMTNALNTVTNGLGVINDIADGNMSGARDKATAAVRGYVNTITAPGRTGFNAVAGGGRDYLNETFGLNLADPRLSPFGGYDPAQATARYRSSEKQAGQGAMNQYSLPGINQPLAQGQRAIDLKIDMSVDIQAANPEDFNDQFQQRFQSVIQETMLQYSEKE